MLSDKKVATLLRQIDESTYLRKFYFDMLID